jgi:hypothetical protein
MRGSGFMRILSILFSNLTILLVLQAAVSAETFHIVDDEWIWFSSNLKKSSSSVTSNTENTINKQGSHLGNAAYDKYFEHNGQPPDYDFLQVLKKNIHAARIEGNDIIFVKKGIRRPLKTDLAPSGADQALPYLMGIPRKKMVLVVYPYYFFGCKDNEHIVEIYSEDGSLISKLNTLPTHVFKRNSDLLISPERYGCCDSLQWSIRFYNLRNWKISKYECPEGACGDLLFVKLAQDGLLVVGLEIIGTYKGVGAFLQTNIAIVNGNGKSIASAKIIQVFQNPLIDKRNIQDISDFSISKLSSLEPISDNGNNRWILEFHNENKKISFEMNGNFKSATPAVVFLAPRKVENKEIIKFNNREIGFLPKIVFCEPGSYAIIGKTSKIKKRIMVQSDQVNTNIY